MANRIPEYLKLHVEDAQDLRSRTPSVWDRLGESFQAATGWRLHCSAPTVNSRQTGISWLDSEHRPRVDVLIDSTNDSSTVPIVPRESVAPLAAVLSDLLTEREQLRQALRQREAELAAAVPVVSVKEDQQHLAERLEAVLHGAGEMLDCQAAGLYMLDEATSYLKLRAGLGDVGAKLSGVTAASGGGRGGYRSAGWARHCHRRYTAAASLERSRGIRFRHLRARLQRNDDPRHTLVVLRASP